LKYEDSMILREGPPSFGQKFRRVAGVLVVLIMVVATGAVFLPATYRVERSVTIPAKAAQIFPDLNNLHNWPEWTIWTTRRYPDLKAEFSGAREGAGASYQWSGKSSGEGSIKITRSVRDKSIEHELNLENDKYVAKGVLTLEPVGGGVRVTWTIEGSLGPNPVNRFAGLSIDQKIGPDFDEALENLRRRHSGTGK
jgi:hypothetical protein